MIISYSNVYCNLVTPVLTLPCLKVAALARTNKLLGIRVGVHIGPCVSGVVGFPLPRLVAVGVSAKHIQNQNLDQHFETFARGLLYIAPFFVTASRL